MLPKTVDKSCLGPLRIKSDWNCWSYQSFVFMVECAPLVCGVDAAIVLDCYNMTDPEHNELRYELVDVSDYHVPFMSRSMLQF